MAGIKKVDKPISAMEATKKAFMATTLNQHQYKGGITVIDQTLMPEIKFPAIPDVNSKIPIAIENVIEHS